MDVASLAVIYTLLGHRLSLKAYPLGEPLRDQAHLRLLRRFEARLSPAWRVRREAVMPAHGDLRAWDARLDGPVSVGTDAETALHDLQALERAMESKQRDSGVQFILLLVSDTHRNRTILRDHRASLRQRFPLGTREVLAALAAGRSPNGNGIVIL